MNQPRDKVYALAIIAHPDDESFLLAGTTLKFKEEGKEVGIICATHGEKGADRLNRNLSFVEMAKVRTSELFSACKILHCECKKFLNYPDGGLDETDLDTLVKQFVEEINVYQPQIILTFGEEGISGHRDHITVHKGVMKACREASFKPGEIWLTSVPASKIDDFNEHLDQRKIHYQHYIKSSLLGVPDDRLTKIDVRKYKDQKLAAIKAHESQYLPHLIWPEFLQYEYFEIIKIKA